MSDIDTHHDDAKDKGKDLEDDTDDSDYQESAELAEGVRLAKRAKCRRKLLIIVFGLGIIAITAIYVGVYFYLSPSSAPSENAVRYNLIETFPSAQTVVLQDDGEQLGVMDRETGCLQIEKYDAEGSETPLCFGDNDSEILSLFMRSNDVVVGRADGVELWQLATMSGGLSDEWVLAAQIPNQNGDAGFGKEVAMIRGDTIIVATDNNTYLFQKTFGGTFTQRRAWANTKGFDFTADRLAVLFQDNTVRFYDITPDMFSKFVHLDAGGVTYESAADIAAVVIDNDNKPTAIYVHDTNGDSVIVVEDLETGEERESFPLTFRLKDDMFYSETTGCIYSLRLGRFIELEVKDADQVVDIQHSGSYVAVTLKRDGATVVELYEEEA